MKMQLAGMEWDACTRSLGRPRSGIHVTINLKNNTLFVAAAAMDLMGKPTLVRVLYSGEHRSIALAQSKGAIDSTAITVSHQHRATCTGGMVCIGDLGQRLRSIGLSGSFRVPMEWHPSGLLWGELSQRTVIPMKARRPKGGAR